MKTSQQYYGVSGVVEESDSGGLRSTHCPSFSLEFIHVLQAGGNGSGKELFAAEPQTVCPLQTLVAVAVEDVVCTVQRSTPKMNS
jgi:hypothetical protein